MWFDGGECGWPSSESPFKGCAALTKQADRLLRAMELASQSAEPPCDRDDQCSVMLVGSPPTQARVDQ